MCYASCLAGGVGGFIVGAFGLPVIGLFPNLSVFGMCAALCSAGGFTEPRDEDGQ